ncbi:uncharacterized protein MONBRDRAFT_27738 [Monosiga brevicollis MX1]|uniref:Guanylate kinase/L-type calcium channel beta subunit domain-containing protein n=1 Tax=Monosiga brevicollis TaxID=81824 RepID=A9V660_MONBE|nr:uncharacterized protein MONBRDRAFT_27738 [Monosiga brevicollis MX1]EDQ87013.1 predicted protein [Monosiga brevicollis MX1]|eukprot:XP_001748252.1 hypothetical protein [Monosiga brevicollis MX1]
MVAHDVVQPTANLTNLLGVIDDRWWVGRVVGQGMKCRMIPSEKNWLLKYHNERSSGHVSRRPRVRVPSADDEGDGISMATQDDERLHIVFNKQARDEAYPDDCVTFRPPNLNKTANPYALAPDVRPLAFVGPCHTGFALTDMMHQALIDYLVMSFPEHVEVLDLDTSQQSPRGGRQRLPTASAADSAASIEDVREIASKEVIDHIYESSRQGKMCILQGCSDSVHRLRKSQLFPIVVHLRLRSQQVLTKLLRSLDDKEMLKQSQSQISFLNRHNAIPGKNCDLVLSKSRLEISCFELASYVDAYLGEATLDMDVDDRLLTRAKPTDVAEL